MSSKDDRFFFSYLTYQRGDPKEPYYLSDFQIHEGYGHAQAKFHKDIKEDGVYTCGFGLIIDSTDHVGTNVPVLKQQELYVDAEVAKLLLEQVLEYKVNCDNHNRIQTKYHILLYLSVHANKYGDVHFHRFNQWLLEKYQSNPKMEINSKHVRKYMRLLHKVKQTRSYKL